MQPPIGCECQTSLLGDGHEITQMPQLHLSCHASQVLPGPYKVFPKATRKTQISDIGVNPWNAGAGPMIYSLRPCAEARHISSV